jgi:hypothetical protein
MLAEFTPRVVTAPIPSRTHPDLPGILVRWFANTLIKTPGQAPADPLAAATLNLEAQREDPKVQLWPEVNSDIIASGELREGEI